MKKVTSDELEIMMSNGEKILLDFYDLLNFYIDVREP